MTDLTELWQKGELTSGWYYVQLKEGSYAEGQKTVIINYFFEFNSCFETHHSFVEKVLAPVPSYDEWQASEKYNKHLEEVIKVYERKDKQATETSIAYNKLAEENEELKEILERHKKATAKAQIRSCDLEIINAKLKELLKECRHIMSNEADFASCHFEKKKLIELIERIDEVLK